MRSCPQPGADSGAAQSDPQPCGELITEDGRRLGGGHPRPDHRERPPAIDPVSGEKIRASFKPREGSGGLRRRKDGISMDFLRRRNGGGAF